MKTAKSYILGLAAAMALTTGFSACQDDFDAPSVEVPVATLEANTTIAELKATFWQDATNYAEEIGTKEDGSHYIIKGRVTSSDENSNVFKFLTIQDETGSMNFSINTYNLYLNYRRGQEIVVDATGMFIGKYAGLQQFGTPSYYENGSTWQVSFMSPEFFRQHIELNGLPEIEKLDTITVNSFTEFDTSAEGLRQWEGQLVRINNVHFQDGGIKTFSEYHSNDNADCNKTLIDADGNSNVIVRTSGYADFWNKTLPEGSGDIVGILNFYQNLSGASNWQLILINYEGCMNFGNPTIAPGLEGNPYTVEEVIKFETDGTPAKGWVSGYIVGTVAPGVTEVTSNEDILWSGEAQMPYTLVIGSDKETKDINSGLVIELPADSPLRELGNLRDNPGNYLKAISVKGTFDKVMGTFGVTDNSGVKSQFKIEGIDASDNIPEGDGTAASPYNASQAKAKAVENGTSSTENVYVKGYIISGEINMTYGTGTWVIANNPDGVGETFTLYATYNTDNGKFTDANAVKTGDLVVAVGPIYNYSGKTPEMSKGHLVSINADDTPTTPSTPSGDGTESKPYTCSDVISMNPTSTSEAVASGVWVEGYIVGYMPTGGSSTLLSGTVFTADANAATTNLVIAPTADTKDASKCIGIQLVSNTVAAGVRDALNLQANPGNLGKKLTIKGDVMKYCGGPGVKNGVEYKLGDQGGSTETPDPTPDPTPSPDAAGTGTEADPYNCSAIIDLNPTSKETAVATDVWVKGYIIGYMPSTGTKPENTVTTAEGCEVKTNLVLAPTATETDFTKCLPIQLPTDAKAPGIRTALNLQDNPGNLGKEVLLKGNVILYCGAPGIKDTSAYKFVE